MHCQHSRAHKTKKLVHQRPTHHPRTQCEHDLLLTAAAGVAYMEHTATFLLPHHAVPVSIAAHVGYLVQSQIQPPAFWPRAL